MHAASRLRPLLRTITRARVTVPPSSGDHPPLLGCYRSFAKAALPTKAQLWRYRLGTIRFDRKGRGCRLPRSGSLIQTLWRTLKQFSAASDHWTNILQLLDLQLPRSNTYGLPAPVLFRL